MHEFYEVVMKAFRKKVLFTRHALDRMNAPGRMIKKDEVYEAIEKGDVVEDYPGDPRDHSCLIDNPCGMCSKGRVSSDNHGLYPSDEEGKVRSQKWNVTSVAGR